MSRPTYRMRARLHRASAAGATLILSALLLSVGAAPASAFWTATGSAAASATTATLAPPTGLTVPASAEADVQLTWAAGVGGVAPEGYLVTRQHGDDSPVAACASSPSNPVTTVGCTDASVPPGDHTYLVTAVYRTWTAPGFPSDVVTVTGDTRLGAAADFSVLAGITVANTGATSVSGNLGVSPGTTVTGFGPGTVGGETHLGDAQAAQAQVALGRAFDELGARDVDAELEGELAGTMLTPGTYHSAAAIALTGTLTLDAQGDPDAVFVVVGDAAFNTSAGSTVVLAGGARAANVFWVVTGAAGTGAGTSMVGTILARGAITLGAGTVLIGRALSTATVTLAGNQVRFSTAAPPTITITGGDAVTTTDVTPTISGTSSAAAASRVTVSVTGQALALPTTVGLDGTWTVAVTTALTAGAHDVVARVRAPSGDGAAASQVLTVEVSPPVVALGSAGTYSVLGGTAVVSTGATSLSGDLGVSPSTTVTGFGPAEGTLDGTIHAGDTVAALALADLAAALDDASSRVPHTEIASDLAGRTFHRGVHHSTAALALTGTVTLDAGGDADAVFIFQADAAFTTSAGSTVVLANGARAANVYWVVAGAAGTGAGTSLVGTVLAEGAITLGATTTLEGRALSLGTVTLAGNLLTGVAPAAPSPGPARSTGPAEAAEPTEAPEPTGSPEPTRAPTTPATATP